MEESLSRGEQTRNAILQAAKNGVNIANASIYVSASPCWNCFKMIANAGIKKVCFGEFYRDERIFDVASRLGIELVDLSKAPWREGETAPCEK